MYVLKVSGFSIHMQMVLGCMTGSAYHTAEVASTVRDVGIHIIQLDLNQQKDMVGKGLRDDEVQLHPFHFQCIWYL